MTTVKHLFAFSYVFIMKSTAENVNQKMVNSSENNNQKKMHLQYALRSSPDIH